MLFGCDLNMLSAIKCVYSAQAGAWGRGMTVGGQCVTVYGGNVERAWSGPRLISICASRCWLVSRPLAGHLPAPHPLPLLALHTSCPLSLSPAPCIYSLYINACLTACVLRCSACHAVVACQRLSLSVCVCRCLCCCCCCCHPACCSHCCCVFPLFDRD